MFVLMQLVGGAAGVAAVAVLYPHIAQRADDAVIPHEHPVPSASGASDADHRPALEGLQ
jgi:hypothetical protein